MGTTCGRSGRAPAAARGLLRRGCRGEQGQQRLRFGCCGCLEWEAQLVMARVKSRAEALDHGQHRKAVDGGQTEHMRSATRINHVRDGTKQERQAQ